ncbi:MAG TPA: sugar phosphate isomerase/epimerase [Lacunisphaera sp.]|nr:sugar phosphate isomerase/epimerase [Lacunisphaera sp.]
MKSSRLILTLLSFIVAALPALRAAEGKVQLGLQTWTCNRMTFDQVVEFAVKHDIKNLQFFSGQFDPAAPKEETLRKKAILDAKGLTCYTFGVSATSLDQAKNRQLFEFAKLIGAKLIIVEPKDAAEWDGLEALVKEYDIRLGIHNHGKGTVYGDPATVQAILAKRDARIGVCLDVGWVTAAGFDAAKVFAAYGNRVYDIHFKDKKVEKSADGKDVVLDVPVGTGAANYPGLFAEIKRSGWSGVLAIETDNRSFQEDPNKLVEEGKSFFAANFGSGAK